MHKPKQAPQKIKYERFYKKTTSHERKYFFLRGKKLPEVN